MPETVRSIAPGDAGASRRALLTLSDSFLVIVRGTANHSLRDCWTKGRARSEEGSQTVATRSRSVLPVTGATRVALFGLLRHMLDPLGTLLGLFEGPNLQAEVLREAIGGCYKVGPRLRWLFPKLTKRPFCVPPPLATQISSNSLACGADV